MLEILNNITKPTLLLDKNKYLLNIKKMAYKAKESGIGFRPHFKTHQSIEIGNWYRDFNVTKITVSSFDMAESFTKAGWNDILVAFPFNIREINRLNELSSKSKISILIDNIETLIALSFLNNTVNFYIDIDTGYGRTGIPAENIIAVENVIKHSQQIKKLDFSGFYCHAGHSYKTNSRDEINKIHNKATKDLSNLKTVFAKYLPRVLYGDTPNCSLQSTFSGIDEITPGNFVFYDLFQATNGSCTEDDIAIAMACPVVGKYKIRNEIVIHGGAVHFSKESVMINEKSIFGKTAQKNETGWKPDSNPLFLDSLSQEHGIVKIGSKDLGSINIGDIILFLPVHSCLTANLMKQYITLEGDQIKMI